MRKKHGILRYLVYRFIWIIDYVLFLGKKFLGKNDSGCIIFL